MLTTFENQQNFTNFRKSIKILSKIDCRLRLQHSVFISLLTMNSKHTLLRISLYIISIHFNQKHKHILSMYIQYIWSTNENWTTRNETYLYRNDENE